jgi:ribosomal protein L20
LEKKDFFNYNTNFKTFKKSRKNDFFLIWIQNINFYVSINKLNQNFFLKINLQ